MLLISMFRNFFKSQPYFEQLVLGQFVYMETQIRALVGHTHKKLRFFFSLNRKKLKYLQFCEFPSDIRANNIETKLVSNNIEIKLFTRKFVSFVNPPPTILIPTSFITLYYSSYFIILTASETHRCFCNKIFFIKENEL